MKRIPRPCVACGRPTLNPRGRCEQHNVRQAYYHPSYKSARALAFRRAGGRCEVVLDGIRCSARATEADHLRPLVEARNVLEAVALNTPGNLLAVCRRHNPRGAR